VRKRGGGERERKENKKTLPAQQYTAESLRAAFFFLLTAFVK
jgi:hypothetical protein